MYARCETRHDSDACVVGAICHDVGCVCAQNPPRLPCARYADRAAWARGCAPTPQPRIPGSGS
eukprot:6277699-Prymnesium_polylepis.2